MGNGSRDREKERNAMIRGFAKMLKTTLKNTCAIVRVEKKIERALTCKNNTLAISAQIVDHVEVERVRDPVNSETMGFVIKFVSKK